MSFPNITNKETIVFPELDTFEKILEAENAYDDWIEGKFGDGGPTPRQIYLFNECVRPWFHELYKKEVSDKKYLIKQYGTYLRDTIIKSSKKKFIEREYWKNFDNNAFSKIVFYLKISLLIWSETGTEQIVIRLGRLMGPVHEHKAKMALSASSNFDNSGKILE